MSSSFATFGISWLKLELATFQEYIDFCEDRFEEKLKEIELKHDKIQKQIMSEPDFVEDPDYWMMNDMFEEEYQKVNMNYIQLFRASQLSMLFSYLELALIQGCQTYAVTHSKVFTPVSKGSSFDEFKRFFKEEMGIAINDINSEWSFLKHIKLLRDLIVHHNAQFSQKDNVSSKQEKGIIDKAKEGYEVVDIVRDEYYEFRITERQLLEKVIRAIKELITKLHNHELGISTK